MTCDVGEVTEGLENEACVFIVSIVYSILVKQEEEMEPAGVSDTVTISYQRSYIKIKTFLCVFFFFFFFAYSVFFEVPQRYTSRGDKLGDRGGNSSALPLRPIHL